MLTTSRLINIISLIKPIAVPEPKVEKVLTEEDKEVLDILDCDITGDIKDIIKRIDKFLLKGPKQVEAFNKNVMDNILQYNFIGNYNYAFLLN